MVTRVGGSRSPPATRRSSRDRAVPGLPTGGRELGRARERDDVFANSFNQSNRYDSDVASSTASTSKRRGKENRNSALVRRQDVDLDMERKENKKMLIKKEGKGRPFKLKLGLDLDIQLEMKARIVGDVTLNVLR